MIFIKTDTIGRVIYMHNYPHELSEDVIKDGILLNEIEPEVDAIDGKVTELYYSATKGLYHIYKDAPINEAEEIKQLKAMIADLGLQIGGGL